MTTQNAFASSTTTASLIRWLSRSIIFVICLGSPAIAQDKGDCPGSSAPAQQKVEIVGKPIVHGNDRVTLRVKVTNPNNDPITDLKRESFQIHSDNQQITGWHLSNPDEATPPPLRMIVLLDFSGSMGEKDASGQIKIDQALNGIQNLLKQLPPEQNQVNLVLFGDPGEGNGCTPPGTKFNANIKQELLYSNNPVREKLLTAFSSPDNADLVKHLSQLRDRNQYVPCAGTNLYNSLEAAVRALRETQTRASEQDPTQLAVILLSDGYDDDTEGANKSDSERFRELSQLLQGEPKVWVHTLGYGKSSAELGKEFGLRGEATRQDADKNKDLAKQFVDQPRLRQMACLTGGISTFSASGDVLSQELRNRFLKALRGQYELSFDDPDPERGSHHIVQVTANQISSDRSSYTTTLFGREVKWSSRILIAILPGVLMVAGAIPFWMWARSLRRSSNNS